MAPVGKRATLGLVDHAQRRGLILQIHNELLFEVPEAEKEAVITLARQAMVGAYPLDPPLAVDVGVGQTWRDTK